MSVVPVIPEADEIPTSHPLPPRRVLIAEDNADLRMIFAKVFERTEFKVQVALDGHEAMQALMAGLPDVLILDINMPNVSGLDVLTYVRRTEGDRHVNIIVVTGNAQMEQSPVVELADLFLLKPVDVFTLVIFAQRLVGNSNWIARIETES